MKYEEMLAISRTEAQAELSSADTARICRALIRLALHDPDRAWLEDVVVAHLESDDPWIRGVAALCAGHIARLHGALDKARIVPLIERLSSDQNTVGRMEDALDDIEMFAGRH